MSAPERIWAWHHKDAMLDNRQWADNPYARYHLPSTEYIRADLVPDAAKIRADALREAFKVVYKWWFGDGNALPQELILALTGGEA